MTSVCNKIILKNGNWVLILKLFNTAYIKHLFNTVLIQPNTTVLKKGRKDSVFHLFVSRALPNCRPTAEKRGDLIGPGG